MSTLEYCEQQRNAACAVLRIAADHLPILGVFGVSLLEEIRSHMHANYSENAYR